MKKITVKSPANIAFIKYWGNRDRVKILPNNDSYSMNLSNCHTITTLELFEDFATQELYIKDYKSKSFQKNSDEALEKVKIFYQTTKKFLHRKNNFGFRVYSKNSFPKKAGIASSASFFSSLALAFSKAFEKELTEKELSILARLSGSGSASRSIPDGFVEWYKGDGSGSSYSHSIGKPNYWDIVDLVLILTYVEKKTGSQSGHSGAYTSPLYEGRLQTIKTRIGKFKEALINKNFTEFGLQIESEAISMHAVMMTQNPPLFYWSEKTLSILKKIIEMRRLGLEAYYTIDAGENVHVICEKMNEKKIAAYLSGQEEVSEIIHNDPAIGARVINIS